MQGKKGHSTNITFKQETTAFTWYIYKESTGKKPIW